MKKNSGFQAKRFDVFCMVIFPVRYLIPKEKASDSVRSACLGK